MKAPAWTLACAVLLFTGAAEAKTNFKTCPRGMVREKDGMCVRKAAASAAAANAGGSGKSVPGAFGSTSQAQSQAATNAALGSVAGAGNAAPTAPTDGAAASAASRTLGCPAGFEKDSSGRCVKKKK